MIPRRKADVPRSSFVHTALSLPHVLQAHVATAGDLLRFGCSLKVECIHCGAARTMNGVEVARVHGNANLHHLAPQLKCTRCQRKHAKLLVLRRVYPA